MASAAAPALAIGLVTFNSARDLQATLSSTARVARDLGVELLVWDNDSSDATLDILRAQGVERVHRNQTNGGFAAGVNGLFAMAGDRDLLLLNPDVGLHDAAQVLRLRSLLREDVGVVAPALQNLDGTMQESARRFPTVVGMAGRTSVAQRSATARRAAERYTALPNASTPTEVDWAIGAALLISSAANREVDGWDEGFFLYLEDVDFCLRLARAGWRTIYDPTVRLTHTHHRESSSERGSVVTSTARRRHMRSALRFFAKHRSVSPTADRPAAPSPVLASAGRSTAEPAERTHR